MRLVRRLGLLAGVLIALAVAGCGGNDKKASTTTAPAATTTAPATTTSTPATTTSTSTTETTPDPGCVGALC
ncbi:MAG: hypothetical protein QOE11_2048 [Solirubrobacteraceae bacterium]|jgi:hypothetical protein|nr:hypothetical protein [Solirubrobacteraceae bacterium]